MTRTPALILAAVLLAAACLVGCTTQPDPPPPNDPTPTYAPCGTYVCLELGCPVLPPDCPDTVTPT